MIRSPYSQSSEVPVQARFSRDVQAFARLYPRYVPGLKDLDGFSHAILLFYFNRSTREDVTSCSYLDSEEHGIFAIRSPHRPNHIGLSVVKINRIEGSDLYFYGADMLDNTPLLDIKPYIPDLDQEEIVERGWLEKHYKRGIMIKNQIPQKLR